MRKLVYVVRNGVVCGEGSYIDKKASWVTSRNDARRFDSAKEATEFAHRFYMGDFHIAPLKVRKVPRKRRVTRAELKTMAASYVANPNPTISGSLQAALEAIGIEVVP